MKKKMGFETVPEMDNKMNNFYLPQQEFTGKVWSKS